MRIFLVNMNTRCEYCCETFDECLKLPLSLVCGHVICKACAEYLSIYKVPSSCPFDNKRVSFKNCNVNQMVLEKIKHYCQEHNEVIIGLCMQHYQKICNLCMDSHQDCEKISGIFEEINQKVNELIRTTITKNNSKIEFHSPNEETFCIENKIVKYWYDHCQVVKKLLEASEKGDETSHFELIKAFEILSRVKLSTLNQIGCFEKVVEEKKPSKSDKKLNKKKDRCITEIDIVSRTQQSKLFFFLYIKTNRILNNYLGVFYNTSKENLMITGLGIGVPKVPNTFILVDLEISTVNGEVIHREQEKIIGSHEYRLTECLELSRRVPFDSNSGLIFSVSIQGKDYFIFYFPYKNKMWKVVEIDGSEFDSFIPILYFTTVES